MSDTKQKILDQFNRSGIPQILKMEQIRKDIFKEFKGSKSLMVLEIAKLRDVLK